MRVLPENSGPADARTAAVIDSWSLMTACVSPAPHLARASKPAATTRSQPSSTFARPAEIRGACNASGRSQMRTWLTTAPYFCARPVMSSTVQPLPSMMGGHSQQRARGNHARAAHSGYDDAIRARHSRGCVVPADTGVVGRRGSRFAQPTSQHRDKAWAKALQTAHVFVAGVLVDRALCVQTRSLPGRLTDSSTVFRSRHSPRTRPRL